MQIKYKEINEHYKKYVRDRNELKNSKVIKEGVNECAFYVKDKYLFKLFRFINNMVIDKNISIEKKFQQELDKDEEIKKIAKRYGFKGQNIDKLITVLFENIEKITPYENYSLIKKLNKKKYILDLFIEPYSIGDKYYWKVSKDIKEKMEEHGGTLENISDILCKTSGSEFFYNIFHDPKNDKNTIKNNKIIERFKIFPQFDKSHKNIFIGRIYTWYVKNNYNDDEEFVLLKKNTIEIKSEIRNKYNAISHDVDLFAEETKKSIPNIWKKYSSTKLKMLFQKKLEKNIQEMMEQINLLTIYYGLNDKKEIREEISVFLEEVKNIYEDNTYIKNEKIVEGMGGIKILTRQEKLIFKKIEAYNNSKIEKNENINNLIGKIRDKQEKISKWVKSAKETTKKWKDELDKNIKDAFNNFIDDEKWKANENINEKILSWRVMDDFWEDQKNHWITETQFKRMFKEIYEKIHEADYLIDFDKIINIEPKNYSLVEEMRMRWSILMTWLRENKDQ